MFALVLTHTELVGLFGLGAFCLFCAGMTLEGWLEARARHNNGLPRFIEHSNVKVLDRKVYDWEQEEWA